MKKPLYMMACLTALLLTSCGPSNSSTNTGDSEFNPGTSVIEPYESFWGSDANDNVRTAIEQSIRYDIPFYEAPTYVAETDDTNGPLDVMIQVSFVGYPDAETSERHCDQYTAILSEVGFKVEKQSASDHGFEFEYYTATKEINKHEYLDLQVVAGGLSETQLGFAVMGNRRPICKPDVFPNNVVQDFLGYKIPEIEYPGMEFTFYNDYTYYHSKDGKYEWYEVYIEVYGGEPTIESEYHAILEEAGYEIEDGYLNQEEGYKATSPDGKHGIQFLWVDNPKIHNTLCILTFNLDH